MKALKVFLFALILMTPALLRAETPAGSKDVVLSEVRTYEELRHAISQARAESRVRVQKAVEQERVREAWEIGRLIDAHVLQHKERADYGEKVLGRLAVDLGISHTELKYMLQFARAYPMSRPADQLSWSHHQVLLSINDAKERQALAERAEKENWGRDRLREEVKAWKRRRASAEGGAPVALETISPVPHSGNPGTYKIILARTGPYAGELAIDLGFSNYVRLADVMTDMTPFKEGDVVAFLEKEGEVRKTREEELYTYRAWVNRVLDGDTIEAVIDLGFGFTTTQTLRLRGIDSPEMKTRDGVEAKEFVESVLAGPKRAGQSIFIRTSKSDKYDRYLADVFITDKSGEEQYLNNLLLEKELAVRVRE